MAAKAEHLKSACQVRSLEGQPLLCPFCCGNIRCAQSGSTQSRLGHWATPAPGNRGGKEQEYLLQRIAIAVQRGSAAPVLRTVGRQEDPFWGWLRGHPPTFTIVYLYSLNLYWNVSKFECIFTNSIALIARGCTLGSVHTLWYTCHEVCGDVSRSVCTSIGTKHLLTADFRVFNGLAYEFILHIYTIPLYYKTKLPIRWQRQGSNDAVSIRPFYALPIVQPPRCLVLFVRTILPSCSAWTLVSGKVSSSLRVLIDTVQKLSAVEALERFYRRYDYSASVAFSLYCSRLNFRSTKLSRVAENLRKTEKV